ncbi:MAG: hypothetical protein EXR99_13405 [Gemmataceae bacterium]|nr:hypothetical protein [Gemmataceae bacterium]
MNCLFTLKCFLGESLVKPTVWICSLVLLTAAVLKIHLIFTTPHLAPPLFGSVKLLLALAEMELLFAVCFFYFGNKFLFGIARLSYLADFS